MSFPPEPKPSAVVILQRDEQVYLVQRSQNVSFFPGFYAFPGGTVEDQDEDGSHLDTLKWCATREVEEELRVKLDPVQLEPAGVVVTPPFSPLRFRTQFFHAHVTDIAPVPQDPELSGGTWVHPEAALSAWEQGEIKLPPPVLHVLDRLATEGPDALTAQGTREHSFPIRFLPGLRVEPLQVGTLPPHTHTNAFIVGDEKLCIVDPGAPPPALDPLNETLDHLEEQGHQVTHVALTHHHEDHTAGTQALLDLYDAELACHHATAEHLNLDPTILLEDGDQIPLDDHRLAALGTPGHAPGHLCFHHPRSNTVLAGDLIAGIGTVLIAPPEGDMHAYMESLQRMASFSREESIRLVFPAHGPPQFDAADTFQATLDHRKQREQRVQDALKDQPRTLEAITADAYEDKPDAPEQLKRLSTRAHLQKLETDGTAAREGDRWRRT